MSVAEISENSEESEDFSLKPVFQKPGLKVHTLQDISPWLVEETTESCTQRFLSRNLDNLKSEFDFEIKTQKPRKPSKRCQTQGNSPNIEFIKAAPEKRESLREMPAQNNSLKSLPLLGSKSQNSFGKENQVQHKVQAADPKLEEANGFKVKTPTITRKSVDLNKSSSVRTEPSQVTKESLLLDHQTKPHPLLTNAKSANKLQLQGSTEMQKSQSQLIAQKPSEVRQTRQIPTSKGRFIRLHSQKAEPQKTKREIYNYRREFSTKSNEFVAELLKKPPKPFHGLLIKSYPTQSPLAGLQADGTKTARGSISSDNFVSRSGPDRKGLLVIRPPSQELDRRLLNILSKGTKLISK